METRVIPERGCEGCNACCIELTIEDPELVKLQGYRCKHVTAERTCGIYDSRPATCRTFNCGWRILPWVKSTLRPDRSGVLIRLKNGPDGVQGIAVHFLNRAALTAEGLAETLAAAVAAGRPVHMVVPGPPGYTSAEAQIDDALSLAVAQRNKAAMLDILREAYRRGKRGKTVPIRLTANGLTAQRP